jgi:ATP-binding cassette subfamily F protein 3
MIPAIRNILGGFLFSGDDVYKRVAVLSGGERTRLAVARMLLRPSNTLLLDEPTNHLDLDSKEVLLDALEDYGGTLIFVSHDRYFVERLATRIIEVGDGKALLYPGTYSEYLWSKDNAPAPSAPGARVSPSAPSASASARLDHSGELRRDLAGAASGRVGGPSNVPNPRPPSYEEQKREAAERRKRERALKNLRERIADLETRIAAHEEAIKQLEASMAAPGFYEAHEHAKPVIDQHQSLMWQVGELLNQWEMLQAETEEFADLKS